MTDRFDPTGPRDPGDLHDRASGHADPHGGDWSAPDAADDLLPALTARFAAVAATEVPDTTAARHEAAFAARLATLTSEGDTPATALPADVVALPAHRPSRTLKIAAAIAAVLVAPAGVLSLSSVAGPGDALYDLKREQEVVRLSLATSDASRGWLLIAQAETRFAELARLSDQGAWGRTVTNVHDALASLRAAEQLDDEAVRAAAAEARARGAARVEDVAAGAPPRTREQLEGGSSELVRGDRNEDDDGPYLLDDPEDEDEPGDDTPGDDEPGDDEPGDPGDDDAREDEPGDDESGEDEPGDDESGEDESGEDESGDDESGDDESGDPGTDEPGDDDAGEDQPGDDKPDDPGTDEPGDDNADEDQPGDGEPGDGDASDGDASDDDESDEDEAEQDDTPDEDSPDTGDVPPARR